MILTSTGPLTLVADRRRADRHPSAVSRSSSRLSVRATSIAPAGAHRRLLSPTSHGRCSRDSGSSRPSDANNTRSAVFATRNDDFFGAYMKLTQFIQTQPVVVSTIMVGGRGLHHVSLPVSRSARPARQRELVFMYWAPLVKLHESDEPGRRLFSAKHQCDRRRRARIRRCSDLTARNARRG